MPDDIPAELKAYDHWLVWKYEWNGTKWDKPPCSPRTRGHIDPTDPKLWVSFAEALAAYEAGGWDGIGYVPCKEPEEHADPFIVHDWDKCRCPDTGVIDPWAQKDIDTLDSYCEASPGGRGVRGFSIGRLPPEGRKKGPFENYEHAHYVTVTGCRLECSQPSVCRRQDQILEVHRRHWPPEPERPKVQRQAVAVAELPEDDELLDRIRASGQAEKFGRLWGGDNDGKKSASEADLSLCRILAFWCRGDAVRIDRLFRRSGRNRDKWDQGRGKQTYGARTVAKAVKAQQTYYEPPPLLRVGGGGTPSEPGGDDEQPTGGAPVPDRVHLTDRGNAMRLVKQHGADLRHSHPWKKWLLWDNRRWRADDTAGVTLRFKHMIVTEFDRAQRVINEVRKQMEESA
jgi:primase-polymerase (primpol)-like protein